MSNRPRKIARRLLIGVLALAVAYLAGANLFLASGKIQKLINGKQNTVVLEWGKAWTLFPGQVEVRDFRIRGTDGEHVEFDVRVEKARGWVDLAALLHREFRAVHVRAEGAVTRVRFPFHPGQEADIAREMPLLPPIPGFADPPLAVLGPNPPPIPDSQYDYWTIRLDDVQIERIHEAWIEQLHWQGRGRAAGSFVLRPLKEVAVGPATAELEDGRLRLGAEGPPIAEDTRGKGSMVLRPFKLQDISNGPQAYRYLDAEGDLSGRVVALGFISHFAPGVRLEGAGPVRLHPVLRGGVVGEGSALEASSDVTELRSGVVNAHGGVRVRAGVEHQHTSVEVLLGQAHVAPAGRPRAGVDARVARLALRDGVIDLAQPLYHPALSVSLEGGRVDELGPWLAALGVAGVKLDRGRAAFDGELHLDPDGRGAGRLKLSAQGLKARVGGTAAEGNLAADLRLGGIRRGSRSADLSGSTLELGQVSATPLARKATGWWGRVQVESGRLALGQGVPRFSGVVKAQGRDARPLLDLLASKGSLPEWVAKLFSLPNLQIRSGVKVAGASVTAESLRIAGGHTEILGRLRVHGRRPTGALLVRSGLLKAGVDLSGEKVGLKLLDADSWFRGQLPPRAER